MNILGYLHPRLHITELPSFKSCKFWTMFKTPSSEWRSLEKLQVNLQKSRIQAQQNNRTGVNSSYIILAYCTVFLSVKSCDIDKTKWQIVSQKHGTDFCTLSQICGTDLHCEPKWLIFIVWTKIIIVILTCVNGYCGSETVRVKIIIVIHIVGKNCGPKWWQWSWQVWAKIWS